MRAVLYCRVSTEEQAEGIKVSPAVQKLWAKKVCAEKGWNFIESFDDTINDSTELELRPGFKRLLEKKSDFDLVLVWHTYRLSRIADLALKAIRILSQSKIQIYFRDIPVEPENPKDYYWGNPKNQSELLIYSTKFTPGLGEKVTRGETTSSARREYAKRGTVYFAPFGFTRIYYLQGIEKKWRFEENEKSAIVKKIYEDYVGSYSVRGLVMKLNAERVPTPTGNIGPTAWSARTVSEILSNPAYNGKVRYGRKLGSLFREGKNSNGKEKRVFTKKEDWIISDAENLKGFIEKKTFDKAQAKLALNGKRRGRAIASKGLFSGLIICGNCGKKGYFKQRMRGKNIGRFYICTNYLAHGKSSGCKQHLISEKIVRQLITDEIARAFESLSGKVITKYHRAVDNSEQIIELKGKLKKIQSKKLELVNSWGQGENDMAFSKAAFSKLEENESKILESLGDFEKVDVDKQTKEEDRKSFIKDVKNFREVFPSSTEEQQKDFFASVIRAIRVRQKGDIEVDWNRRFES